MHEQKGWDRGGCRVYPNGVNIMAVSELSYRNALVGLGLVGRFSPVHNWS